MLAVVSFAGSGYGADLVVEAPVTADQTGGNDSIPGQSGSGNSVTVTGNGNVTGDVTGGITNSGEDAAGNTVTVESGGTVDGNIKGGEAIDGGDATENNVALDGEFYVTGNVYGGSAEVSISNSGESGSATNNSVTLTNSGGAGGGSLEGSIYGGAIADAAGTGVVSGNRVAINTSVDGSSVTVDHGVVAGITTGLGAVSNNSIAINAADATVVTIDDIIVGGATSNTGAVSGNTIALDMTGGATVDVDSIIAGRNIGPVAGDVNNNSITINAVGTGSGPTIDNNVVGGQTNGTGDVTGNTVAITMGTGASAQIGGYVAGGHASTAGHTGAVSGNSVILDAADDAAAPTGVGAVYGGYTGSSTTGAATNNTVDIRNADVTGAIYGGYMSLATNTADVTGNTVTIDGANTVTAAVIAGGYTFGTGAASNNEVTIRNGAVTGNVYGGSSDLGSASNNTVNLFGGTYGTLNVFGGSGSVDSTGNVINVGLGVVEATLADVSLYGGNGSGSGDARTGNTLNFFTDVLQGTRIADIANFDVVNIREIPDTMIDGDTFILNAAGDFTDTTVRVTAINSNSALTTGNTVTLFDVGTNYAGGEGRVGKGMAEIYEVDYTLNAGKIDMELGARLVNNDARYLSLGRLAAVSFADRAGDLAAYTVYNAATAAFAATPYEPCGGRFTTFAAAAGAFGNQDYGSGSMDIDGFNFLAGLGYRNYTGPTSPSFLFAAFFEGGFGKYEDGVNAEGDLGYAGAGLLGRIDAGGGFYAEAAVRVGQLTNDFNSGVVSDGSGRNFASYGDQHNAYYGGHAAAGYAFTAGSSKFDFSAKYLLTHVGADSLVILGQDVDYDSVNSQRLRLGGRWSTDTGSCVTPYVGTAFEYQFDGVAATRVDGFRVPDTELKGASGIVDAGLRFRALSDKVNANVGVYGAFGTRQELGIRAFLGIDF